jgi:uncharacterized protein (TIGR02588 family)
MDQQTKQRKIKDTPWWLLSIASLGLVLVAGSIVFMLYEAVAGDASPPDIKVRVETTEQTRNGYLVKFRAVNEGGSTAEGVTVEGVLRSGTEVLEVSDTILEWVPAHSEREGGLLFTSDPRQYQFQLRARGYENP